MEICIRPENEPSLRVVQKLGFRYEGLRRRYIHINGDWRDHYCFALTVDELPQGVLRRWLDGLAPESDAEIPPVDRARASIPLRITPRR
jgi:ribosomal-protein-alanine N-acetyltransferase